MTYGSEQYKQVMQNELNLILENDGKIIIEVYHRILNFPGIRPIPIITLPSRGACYG